MGFIGERFKVKKFEKETELKAELSVSDGESGIYIIYNLSTGWCYVGQTTNLKTRYRTHLSQLRKNEHKCCPKLQEIYNQFGEEDLIYVPVFKCPDFMLREVERVYIYKLGLKVLNEQVSSRKFTYQEIGENKIFT